VLVTNPPAHGTFYLLSAIPSVPYPFDPYYGTLPVYAYDGVFFVDNTPTEFFVEGEGGGMMLMAAPSPPGITGTNSATDLCCNSLTNFTAGYLYSTNGLTLGIAQTTNPWVALTIKTATTNASYDVFGTTNMVELALPSLGRTNWTWLMRANGRATNFSWGLTNWCERYFQLGTMADGDNDGLSTAYEQLVSKTATNVANSPRALYETAISNQSPSAWFKLNNASLADAQGGQSLTNGGGAWDVDAFAIGNSAFSFTASSHGLTTGDIINGGTGTNKGSMSLLFRSIDGYSSNTVRYVFYQNNDFGAFFEPTNTTSANPGSLKVHVGGQTNAILLSNDLVFGALYHLTLTWDETNDVAAEVTWHLGRVGGTLTSGTIDLTNNRVVGSNTTVYLGNDNAANRAFRGPGFGALDEIVFWNRELTGPEVNAQFDTLKVLFQGPSKVFDLTRWELTLPVDKTNNLDNTHLPLDINTAWLNAGFKYVDPTNLTQKYFYLSTTNTMVFEAPWNGADQDTASPATSLGSPRSELRETLANGGEFNWKPYDPATGTATNTHTLQATCRLESMPSKVIFGQIHAETPIPAGGAVPAVTLFHEGSGTANKRIRLAVYYSPDRSVTISGNQDQTFDLVSGVNLGDRIDYELKLVGTSNSTVRLTATVATNGVSLTPRVVSMTSDAGYSGWGATNVTLYFKAGCYYPKAATNSGTAQVTFTSLGVIHQLIPMKLLTTFSLALLATLNIHAQGLIWSASHSAGSSVLPGASWQIAFDHTSEDAGYPPSLNPVSSIFSMSLGTNDAGYTFFASALSASGFAGFVAGLTDGANGYLRFQNPNASSWQAGSEQLFLGRSLASPDLAGYSITQIGFRVSNFYDYFDVQEDRYFRQLDYSLDFYGAAVPEPSTWALLGLGGAATLLLRRKARGRN